MNHSRKGTRTVEDRMTSRWSRCPRIFERIWTGKSSKFCLVIRVIFKIGLLLGLWKSVYQSTLEAWPRIT